MRDNTEHNKAYGAHLQPFSGIPTFMRLPANRSLDGVDVAVYGIPFDSGTSYRSGTRFGPRKIREASMMLWGCNTVLGVEPVKSLQIIDYGDAAVIPVDIKATQEAITEEVASILAEDVTVISLGGDHSVTLPLLRAHAKKYGPVAVVHFDAHIDTWDEEYDGHPYSHGTPFYWALREGLVDEEAYVQVGIRGSTSSPDDLKIAKELGARTITIEEAFNIGTAGVIEEIHSLVGEKPVYVSLDIDAVDPAYAPGTGTPEPFGLNAKYVRDLIRDLAGYIVGFDVVEVCPPFDNGNTSALAAKLIREFISCSWKAKLDSESEN